MRNCWCFVSGICNDHFWLIYLKFIIQRFECSAVVFVPRMYTIAKNPSMLITSCFYGISKNMFVFSFMEPSAFWM